ncbi:unnamed protein product [Leptosia nina]|uniref:Uncharacterized protein n=1 Tax=Leptosia nina TaxID=320188 RepID=A0AAV1JHV8_9NEOP
MFGRRDVIGASETDDEPFSTSLSTDDLSFLNGDWPIQYLKIFRSLIMRGEGETTSRGVLMMSYGAIGAGSRPLLASIPPYFRYQSAGFC